ncbi:endo-1,4-beta-xylanase [Halomicrobium salinisoli]|uniref:endo-1,4-beta-xylanase n=1 Tax=Halomicrobium salinisoli TaxID=2878391 RepID=UPI001CF00B14|nr:endo-1,4-beta-xylanase [Halomicrobium salinisoli]
MTNDTNAHQGGVSDEKRDGDIGRRDYLRTVGVGTAMGVLGGTGAGTAAAQSDDWEAAADERIQEHRTGPLEIEVVDENGDPVSDADVAVEMQDHDYWFGYALSADLLVNQTEPGHPYRETLKEDFNVVWFGNYHKWRFFEDNQDDADEATAWAKDNGLDVRGHVCLWANIDAWAVPGDVVDAMGVDHDSGQDGPDLDPQHVEDRSFEHVQTIIDHYADFEYEGTSYGSVIEEWEVMNEVVHKPGFIRAVNGVPANEEAEDLDPVTAPLLADYYDHARDAAPDDVGLATNDYNTIEGSYDYARDDYERQIEFLEENSSLDYVGLQSHFTDRSSTVSSQETMDVLDRYAQHDVRLRVTEFDVTGDWPDEDKADWFREYFKTVFSHPATDAFLTAGGSDEHHWRDDGPFYYEGWEPKPAMEVYRDLVFDEWWTEESGTTDDAGTYSVDAFLGEHEVTVSTGEGSVTRTVSVTDSDAGRQVTVTVEGGDGPPNGGDDRPPAVGDNENQPTDPDGDGLYEDLNGNGEVDYSDVVDYFNNMETDDFQSNAAYYDYNGNGEVDYADLVDLFNEI